MTPSTGSTPDGGAITPGLQGASGQIILYSSGRRRAIVVIILFGAGICLVTVLLALDALQFWQMGRMIGGESVSETELDINYFAQFALSLTYFAWWLATIVAFLMWIHRAHRNLPSLGADDLEFSPAGAVGWYFFPFLNLFKPYQVMREIYNASDPEDLPYPIVRWRDRAPGIVKSWWGLFLFSNFVKNGVSRMRALPDTPESFQFVAGASIVDDIITIAAMYTAMALVQSIDRRQQARATSLAAGSRAS